MRHLRSQGVLPPTIVLTAFGSLENAVTTVHEYGGFWFLEKPVQPGVMRAWQLPQQGGAEHTGTAAGVENPPDRQAGVLDKGGGFNTWTAR